MEEQVFDFYHPIEKPVNPDEPQSIVEFSPMIEQQIADEQPKRTINCPTCNKVFNCMDRKYDFRILMIHSRRWHKEVNFPTKEEFYKSDTPA